MKDCSLMSPALATLSLRKKCSLVPHRISRTLQTFGRRGKNISLGSWNPVAPHLHSPQVKFQNFIFSRPKKLRILKSLPPILNLPSVCTGGVIIKDRSPKIRQRWNATIFEDFSTKQQSPRCRIRQDLPKEKLPVQKSFVFGCQGKETELR